MVIIPAGSFRMGSPEDEPDREEDEGPQRLVTIASPFAMARYAVTFEEYDRFAAATSRLPPLDEGWGRGRQPVERRLHDHRPDRQPNLARPG